MIIENGVQEQLAKGHIIVFTGPSLPTWLAEAQDAGVLFRDEEFYVEDVHISTDPRIVEDGVDVYEVHLVSWSTAGYFKRIFVWHSIEMTPTMEQYHGFKIVRKVEQL